MRSAAVWSIHTRECYVLFSSFFKVEEMGHVWLVALSLFLLSTTLLYGRAQGAFQPVVTLKHSWAQIYDGETVTLRCEVERGAEPGWEYLWRIPGPRGPILDSYKPEQEFTLKKALPQYSGDYSCRGRFRGSDTEWSRPFTLTVSDDTVQPVLTVSPLWLSPGSSVTLSCRVQPPSEGWRIYWYEVVPHLSGSSYRDYKYTLLPGSFNGTEQETFIIDEVTHTSGYVCGVRRGDDLQTFHSRPRFAWSEDSPPAASLSVSPDRAQHFNADSVFLSCEGNSSQWRVRRLDNNGDLSNCSSFGNMAGPTCTGIVQFTDSVLWCESGSGQFSNAVNITSDLSVILLSPARAVTEGEPVTLGCKYKNINPNSTVFFYKGDTLIQNDTRSELTIPAVSKADEGSYKCRRGTRFNNWMSPESWMSVREGRTETLESRVILVVVLVCGILLILLLLSFFLYKRRNSCFRRLASTSGSSPACHAASQGETHQDALGPPVRVSGREDAEKEESMDVTYTTVHLSKVTKKGGRRKPDEHSVYSDVRTGAPAGDALLYAQVQPHTGKTPAAEGEPLYSIVKPGKKISQ